MSSPGDTATQPHLSGLKGLDEAAAAAAEAKAEAAAAIVTRVEGEKNALAIVCPRPDCACKIFTPNTAVLLTDHVVRASLRWWGCFLRATLCGDAGLPCLGRWNRGGSISQGSVLARYPPRMICFRARFGDSSSAGDMGGCLT